jgi:hypothetical protein
VKKDGIPVCISGKPGDSGHNKSDWQGHLPARTTFTPCEYRGKLKMPARHAVMADNGLNVYQTFICLLSGLRTVGLELNNT